jgi:hypothetical protein
LQHFFLPRIQSVPKHKTGKSLYLVLQLVT